MDTQLASLATLFQQTLDPSQRKGAEEQLKQLQSQPRFAFVLLALVQSEAASTAIRLAAAIQFKNLCKTRWDVDSETEDPVVGAIGDEEKQLIRTELIPVLRSLANTPTPSQAILAQMNESIALVSQSDFPHPWSNLIDELVQSLNSDNYHVLLSVLSTSHAIFRRWRSMFRSDALYTEINLVLSKFATPLLELLERVYGMIVNLATPAQNVPPLASCLVLLLQLFYDLSAQDLPPQFEDALPALSPMFTGLLSFSRPELVGDVDDMAPSPLDKIRSSVCEIFELYAKRYLDALPQLPQYVQAVWDMLGTYGPLEKYDVLVSKAILFLAVVVRMGSQRQLFEAESTLEQFCSKIIMPNIELRDVDEEMFEDNPVEYIRRDLETSVEVDTRRRAAYEFVRALLEQFSEQTTAIASRYIREYLDLFRKDPGVNWRRKDAAIYLLTCIAAQGSTAQHGVSSTNNLVDVVQFFSDHILEDLQPENAAANSHPILQVDAIKYLYTFRNQLTKDQLLSVLPLLVHHLASTNYVTCTYAAVSIERILFIKHNGQFMFSAADIARSSEAILAALFAAIQRNETPEKVAENDHLMKCIMRVLLTLRQSVEGHAEMTLAHLITILGITAKNPSNPRFTQFLFESISALIRYAGSGSLVQASKMEQGLFPSFTEILQADVVEYIPYVFQILAQLLEVHVVQSMERTLPEAYANLLPPLLTPTLWEQKGNVPALVRLLKAYLHQAPSAVVQHVEAFLGVYQKLISSRLNDVFGFELLLSLIRNIPANVLAQYQQPILTLMLMRLQSSKTDKFSQHFVIFFAVYCSVLQPSYPEQVVQAFEAVQQGLFMQIVQNVVVPDLAKLQAKQRFGVAAGLIRLLTSSPSMLASCAPVWPILLGSVLRLMMQTENARATPEEDEGIAELDEQGFQASFSQLAAAKPSVRMESDATDWAGTDLGAYLARQLYAASQQHPGVLGPLIASIPADVHAVLDETLQKHSVQIV
ncbi:importin-alpha export receptor [Malassezia vespertilionis]|uniref:Cse1p n=1 Tax=Malassezia vespertilionis TaxID=2020962 RepID=A0A2N1JDT3_9BASI|nr:importin-alpha export receptor [Malassezia vespertilionis]PKI84694.1 Cse1p [Malassezia vespertilionis]WFD05875.1 importin-alpha export receptor [Malassezia vespertilionis]